MRIIDYDKIEIWESWVTEILFPGNLSKLKRELKNKSPQYMEDAADIVIDAIGCKEIVSRFDEGFKDCNVKFYHGTRVSNDELESIRNRGLMPLLLKDRKNLLVSILRHHSDWSNVEHRLDKVLEDFGSGKKGGLREDNSAHACFSRAGLMRGCSHYLTHGAEVDGHIVNSLFSSDKSALELLRRGRNPYLVSFIKSYKESVKAASPFGVEEGELPSLLSLLLNAWAYRQYDGSFLPEKSKNCTAAIFNGGVNQNEICQFELLSDDELAIDL